MHIEWDIAASCRVEVLTAAQAEEELYPDGGIQFGSHVLVLGGDGGGQLAVEGDINQLTQLIVTAARALAALYNPPPGITAMPAIAGGTGVLATGPAAITP